MRPISWLERALERPDPATLLCLWDEAVLVACALLEPGRPDADGSASVSIGMVTVSPARQNRGLGRLILEKAEQWARRAGALTARMTVISVRAELLAWYGRRGYRPTGETARFPYGEPRVGRPLRDDLAFLVLSKDLRAGG